MYLRNTIPPHVGSEFHKPKLHMSAPAALKFSRPNDTCIPWMSTTQTHHPEIRVGYPKLNQAIENVKLPNEGPADLLGIQCAPVSCINFRNPFVASSSTSVADRPSIDTDSSYLCRSFGISYMSKVWFPDVAGEWKLPILVRIALEN